MAFTWLTGFTVDGNVGIGTDSPGQKLEVDGVIESPYLEYKPVVFYDFNSDTISDWGQGSSTLSVPDNSITRYTTTGLDSNINRSFNFDGGQNQIIRIRYKVVSGTVGSGQIFYANSVHGYSGSYYKSFSLVSDTKWHTLVLDMSSLNSGGTDWVDNIITAIRFDLTDLNPVVIDLDWISIGGNGYGTQYFENDVSFMDGVVGIGTTNPVVKLNIVGLSGLPATSGTAQNGGIRIENGVNNGVLDIGASNATGAPGWLQSTDKGDLSAGYNLLLNPNGGNVGVGTTSPSAKLHIQGEASSNGGIRLHNSGGNPYSIWSDNNDLFISKGDGTSTAISVKYGGNVGIGTTSPSAKLDIEGDFEAGYALKFTNTKGTGSVSGFRSHGVNGEVTSLYRNSTEMQGWNENGTSYFNGGNVGIGTNSPGSKLEVNVTDDTFNDIDVLRLKRTWATGSSTDRAHGILFNDINSRMATIYADRTNSGSNYNSQLLFSVNSGASGTSMITPMVINNLGRVGIGTTSPSANLNISGTGTGGAIDWTNTTATTGRSYRWVSLNAGGFALEDLTDSGAERMLITPSGDVEIGFNGGGYRLNVGVSSYGDYSVRASGRIYSDTNTTGQTVTGLGSGIFGSNAITSSHALDVTGNSFLNGNVGIGTTSPGSKLEIKQGVQGGLTLPLIINPGFYQSGSSSGIGFLTDGNASYTKGALVYTTNGSGWNIGDFQFLLRDDGNQSLVTLADAKMTIKASGNVGIGVTSPTNQLHVHTDTDNAYAIRIEGSTNNGAGVWTGLGIGGEATNSKSALLFEDVGESYARGKLHLCVNNELNQNIATPADAKLTISNDGNVGIGTTSPDYKLDVLGTGYYSGQLTIDGFTNNSGISFRKGYSPTNTGIRAKAVATANRDGLELLGYNGIDFTVNNGANVAMRIVGVTGSGMGNVGIGTTSPSENLSIVGASTQGELSLQAGPTVYAGYKFRMSAQAAEMGFIMEMGGTKILKSYGYNNADSVGLGILNNEDLIYMRAGGNVGIGTTSPTQAKLCVSGATFQTGDLTLADQNTYSPEIKMTNSAHTIGIDYQNNETLRFITRSGVTTVPITFQMRAGTITATNFILSSDERKKTKVKDLSRDSISVNWKSFEMKENEGEYRTGVIAQELEEKHPEFVRTDDEGMKSVAYIDLLIAKIAELEARLEKADDEGMRSVAYIDLLIDKIAELDARLEKAGI